MTPDAVGDVNRDPARSYQRLQTISFSFWEVTGALLERRSGAAAGTRRMEAGTGETIDCVHPAQLHSGFTHILSFSNLASQELV